VVKCQGDRIEHVLPVALFPTAILGQIHAERWEAMRDRNGDLGLLGLAVAGDGGPYALGRLHRERRVAASG